MKSIRVVGAVGLAVLLGWGASAVAGAEASEEAALERARAATKELMGTLQSLLKEELAAGAPEGAIHACAESAPAVAARLSAEPDLHIRRVSLRHRNPENVPDDYERAVLEGFDRAAASGKNVAEHVEVVGEGSARELRLLRPLVAADVCLRCHGPADRLSPELKKALAERYPGDTATGYAAGDVRGAVTVRVWLDAAGAR